MVNDTIGAAVSQLKTSTGITVYRGRPPKNSVLPVIGVSGAGMDMVQGDRQGMLIFATRLTIDLWLKSVDTARLLTLKASIASAVSALGGAITNMVELPEENNGLTHLVTETTLIGG